MNKKEPQGMIELHLGGCKQNNRNRQFEKSGISAKAKALVDIIRENPYQIPPRYEKLVGNLDGIISRRINIQHRLVYQVYEEAFVEEGMEYRGTVKIIRMWTTHYEGIR